jgi:hypothetical protein
MKSYLFTFNPTKPADILDLYSKNNDYGNGECDLKEIINWEIRALNAVWLKYVVYPTVYHGYDEKWLCTSLITW